MEAIKAYYDGRAFVPVFPVNVAKNRVAIITILDNIMDSVPEKTYLQYVGKLSDDSYQEMTAILQDTRKIEKNEW
ncbi:hypothetical protein NO2_1079 [Candidatus Termititenax persephonae]|uniref:Uncharacterized protein n=1 Tax=Candidatus Termititenax persephonae TaxID=2218525 RepID=A0A388THE1_9BACT|nr:hypothetical protein NO2_1079 [Candidatus Termititenax persephonae]